MKQVTKDEMKKEINDNRKEHYWIKREGRYYEFENSECMCEGFKIALRRIEEVEFKIREHGVWTHVMQDANECWYYNMHKLDEMSKVHGVWNFVDDIPGRECFRMQVAWNQNVDYQDAEHEVKIGKGEVDDDIFYQSGNKFKIGDYDYYMNYEDYDGMKADIGDIISEYWYTYDENNEEE